MYKQEKEILIALINSAKQLTDTIHGAAISPDAKNVAYDMTILIASAIAFFGIIITDNPSNQEEVIHK